MQGIFVWFNKNLRGRQGQKGFTLIELLVVVTILGILAGIVTLSLVGLTTNASIQSCNQEYKTVQAALDAAMADNNLSTITAQTTATNSMSVVIGTNAAGNNITLYNPNPTSANPNYTRNGTTVYQYTWDSAGKINGISDSKGVNMQPLGCKVT